MNKKLLILFIFAGILANMTSVYAQHHHHHSDAKSDAHIAGHVLDAHTKEHLSFVNV